MRWTDTQRVPARRLGHMRATKEWRFDNQVRRLSENTRRLAEDATEPGRSKKSDRVLQPSHQRMGTRGCYLSAIQEAKVHEELRTRRRYDRDAMNECGVDT